MNQKHLVIFGAGAWGTALAIAMDRKGHQVTLVCRREEQAEELKKERQNRRYLPGINFSSSINITDDLSSLSKADSILWVIPAQRSYEMAVKIKNFLPANIPIIICSKGIDYKNLNIKTGIFLSDVIGKALPNPIAVLSGPNFAIEVAKGLPAAATLAASCKELAQELAEQLRYSLLRVYSTIDSVGVQVAGALKNVFAIASGIIMGTALGLNANAALITRSLAEIRRFGQHFDAKSETFMGLAAVGDLILTCSSPQSRNMSLGMALGQGKILKDILQERYSVTEGVYTAQAVYTIAQAKKIHMPISEAVYNILYQNMPVQEAIQNITSRQSESEFL